MRTSTILITLTLLLIPLGATSAQAPPPGVSVPDGYDITPAVTGLDFPSGIAYSEDRFWISEAGNLPQLPLTVKEVTLGGDVTTVLTPEMLPEGVLAAPLTDVTYHDGMLWISHRQMGVNGWMVGAISKFSPDDPAGTFTTVITNLPSSGDHHTDELAFDATGRAYFGQGSASNASVIGADNFFITGWLGSFPTFHDFVPVDVVLNGSAFETAAPFPLDPEADDITAPFMAFGSGPVEPGTVVPGASPASPQEGIIAGNGTVYSFDPSADDPTSTLQVEAWGLRNPFGVGLDPFNPDVLFVANNGADVRQTPEAVVSSRPIAADYDDVFTVDVGGEVEFFGWPDYFHDPETGAVLPVTDPLFCSAEEIEDCAGFVLDEAFRNSLDVQPAFAQPGNHISGNKFAFSTTTQFGFVGDLFLAETGAFVPSTGAEDFNGYKVSRINRETGEVEDFIVNEGNTAEEIFDPMSFNMPIDVKFVGGVMLVVDFGIFEPGMGLAQPGTGKVWAVSRGASATFNDQPSDGRTVTVASAFLPDGGFVAIHESEDGEMVGPVIGVSDYLTPGAHADVEATLFEVPGLDAAEDMMLTMDQFLIAMPHRDTNENEVYDFLTSGGSEDIPYFVGGDPANGPVIDPAFITVDGAVAEDVTPPECELIAVEPGPPTTLRVRVRDGGSGLADVRVVQAKNATVNVPDFAVGFQRVVFVTAEKLDEGQRSTVVLEVEDRAGNVTTCDPVLTTVSTEVPETFTLGQNYPNPFNPTTTITFQLAEASDVRLTVYDVMGRAVSTLVQEPMEAGTYTVEWEGADAAGRPLPSGLYLYRIEAGTFNATRSMTLLK